MSALPGIPVLRIVLQAATVLGEGRALVEKRYIAVYDLLQKIHAEYNPSRKRGSDGSTPSQGTTHGTFEPRVRTDKQKPVSSSEYICGHELCNASAPGDVHPGNTV